MRSFFNPPIVNTYNRGDDCRFLECFDIIYHIKGVRNLSKVMPVAGKIANQRHLGALRDGIILAMPPIIQGYLIIQFPV